MTNDIEHHLGNPTVTSVQDYGLVKRMNQISKYVNIKNNIILDVGCGNGIYSLKFGELGAKEIIGIDIEDIRLKKAKDFAVNYKNIRFYHISAEKLPFGDCYFDIILLADVLEHILYPEIALKEMNRVLKKDGIIILFVPNKWWIYDQHGINIYNNIIDRPLLFSWLPDIIRKRFERAPVFTSKKIKKLLQDAGFVVNNVNYLFPPFDKVENAKLRTFLRRISIFAEKRFKTFGHSIFVVGKKE